MIGITIVLIVLMVIIALLIMHDGDSGIFRNGWGGGGVFEMGGLLTPLRTMVESEY